MQNLRAGKTHCERRHNISFDPPTHDLVVLVSLGSTIAGSIPPQLGNLEALTLLSLYQNELCGECGIQDLVLTLSTLRPTNVGHNRVDSTLLRNVSVRLVVTPFGAGMS